MKFEEILEGIKALASRQGLYSRLYREIMENKENDTNWYHCFKNSMESQNFKDFIDFVLWFEC
nr:MAG TPA: hypothetical protein [Caudoviricetes sp.]